METEILRMICAGQGAVNTEDLMYNLFSGDPTKVSEIISNREKFARCCPNGQEKVVARTHLRLCRAKDCPGTCRGLHLCKNFLFGFCEFSQLRRGCCFSHELTSEHNQRLLRQHELESLSREELCTLLLQSDHTLLPAICYNYNNGDGEFGRCRDGDGCRRLHICENYISRECSCWKNHDFNAPQPFRALKARGVPDTLFQSLKAAYANKQALKLAGVSDHGQRSQRGRGRGGHQLSRGFRGNRGSHSSRPDLHRARSLSNIAANIDGFDLWSSDRLNESDDDNSPTSDITVAATRNRGNHQRFQNARSLSDIHAAVNDEAAKGGGWQNNRQRPVRDKTGICMYFIKGHCKHQDRCFKAHDKMPYRWQVQEGHQWTDLPDNETIERDYCDPSNSYSSTSPAVHFDTMTCGSNKVRRLSTENSVIEPTFIHTTEWLWYWQDEFGKWNTYSADTSGHKAADINSTKLEEKFLANDKDVVEFTAGSQSYSLSFQDMIQSNKRYGTKRCVCRRPLFVSAADVLTKKVRRPVVKASAPIPDNWDKTQIPETGYSRISVQRTSDEFKTVETHFCKTMKGFDIVKIERIQNKALWEVFQWQKNQMKTKNKGGNVTEKKLFHGTHSKFVDTICHHNFDWRICGLNGTAFGKGSYFARDARYSHNYTGDTDVRDMFISRVLVGDFTKGSSDYRRPPSKDGGDINFYDSCVDDVMNPSIYVVFEKHQIYPEYLIKYKTTLMYSGGASAPAPKPVAAPKPATISAYQPSTISSGYKASTSASFYSPNTTSSPHQSSSVFSGYPSSSASSGYPSSSASSGYPSSSASSGYPSSSASSGYPSSSASSGYQYTTSYSNIRTVNQPTHVPPSPSAPPKKSSDSCVIA
ncbi:protein mono-ADP-ribosyltransferase PARP12 isoform X4 [Simochromis diagramma]|uniref:protein mono-ADP-ribosyltransferase PARP12 isoform X4 n=1 Tax=Simochromis diagramma TaxID=43689 RepID=UPI001A7E7C04|nr:protein mono-ADP-ribosyltransferase PARP12 isoform X4 [Simochromis diagramma]